ncbi:2-dehydropantoate 2-reductase, partial [Syncephalis fuscata]
SSTNKHYTVGTGAIGAYYGWRLQSAGCRVICVCRSNYTIVKENGFQIKSTKHGDNVFQPWQVIDSVQSAAAAVPDGFDYVVVCTKSLPELSSTADTIAPAITANKTAVVLIQNGVGIEEPVAQQFPHNPCISCVAYIGVTQIAPGVISHALRGDLRIGSYNRVEQPIQTQEPDTNRLAQLFEAGGVAAMVMTDIQPVRWNKIVWNAGFGIPAVLTGLHDTHSMLNEPDCHQLIEDIMTEIWDTAVQIFGSDKYPGPSPPSSVMEHMSFTGKLPAYKPSILVDYMSGNPMEVEVIIGNPIREAKKHNIEMPRLETLYKLMHIAAKQKKA